MGGDEGTKSTKRRKIYIDLTDINIPGQKQHHIKCRHSIGGVYAAFVQYTTLKAMQHPPPEVTIFYVMSFLSNKRW